MKQSFGKTLMSCFLAVTLMASVLAGAISVTCSPAKANDSAASGDAYLDDIYDYLVSTAAFNTTTLTQWFEYVTPYVQNETPGYFMVALEEDGNWQINLYQFKYNDVGTQPYTFYTGYNSYSGLSYYSNGNANYDYADFWNKATLKYYDGYGSCSISQSSVGMYRSSAYVWSKSSSTADRAIPTVYEKDYVGRNVYCSMAMAQSANSNYAFSKNLFAGSAMRYFNLVTFSVGIKRFITIDDQDYLQGMDPDKEGYTWYITGLNDDSSDFSIVLHDSDLVVVPNADFYTDELFNLATYGALVYELPESLDVIAGSAVYYRDSGNELKLLAAAANIPYWIDDHLPSEDELIDQQYIQAFNTFNSYVNSYNTTHVIPENLAQTLFGVEGGKLYPVTVSEPSSVAATRNDGALVDGNLYTFHWSMTEPTNLGYNYDLFDVVIIPSNYAGYYGLVYFYDSSLNPPYQFVDRVSFDSLLDSFDCIIILPDDAGTLEDNTWWQQLVPSSMRGDMAVGGTSSLGIEYVDTVSGNEFQGFMIVTQKAIQKQQLWNFNDGITKLYKLEVDYIDSEDKWKDSFLLWSASIFDMLNSIDGRLNSILNSLTSLSSVIDQIKTTLNEIAADPDPDEVKPWYLSLWLFMKQFEPSNAQISEGLGYLVDNIDDIPLLPALTPVPALPTPGGG